MDDVADAELEATVKQLQEQLARAEASAARDAVKGDTVDASSASQDSAKHAAPKSGEPDGATGSGVQSDNFPAKSMQKHPHAETAASPPRSSEAGARDIVALESLMKQLLQQREAASMISSPPPAVAPLPLLRYSAPVDSSATLEALVAQLQERLASRPAVTLSGSRERTHDAVTVPAIESATAATATTETTATTAAISATATLTATTRSTASTGESDVAAVSGGSAAAGTANPKQLSLPLPSTRQRTEKVGDANSTSPRAPRLQLGQGMVEEDYSPNCSAGMLLQELPTGTTSCSVAAAHLDACCHTAPVPICPPTPIRAVTAASFYGGAGVGVGVGTVLAALLFGFIIGNLFERFRRRRRQCSPVAPVSVCSPEGKGVPDTSRTPATMAMMKTASLKDSASMKGSFGGFLAAGCAEVDASARRFNEPLVPERQAETEWEPFAGAESAAPAVALGTGLRAVASTSHAGGRSSLHKPHAEGKSKNSALDDLWQSESAKCKRCSK